MSPARRVLGSWIKVLSAGPSAARRSSLFILLLIPDLILQFMPFRERLRRLPGRLMEVLETGFTSDNPPSQAALAHGECARTTATSAVSSVGEQTGATSSPKLNAGSPKLVPSPSPPVNQPTTAPADPEESEKQSWPKLGSFLHALDRSPLAFGPLKVMTSGLVDCIEMYERAANNHRAYNKLRIELENIFETLEHFLAQVDSPVMTNSMESLCKSIQKELDYVQRKQDRGTVERHLEAGDDSNDVLECFQHVHIYFQRLSLNVNMSMWKIVDEQATNALLDRLCSSIAACYNSSQALEVKRGACTPGTRVDVLGQMHGWIHNPATGSVYWLNGMAGTGKTTIAYTLCEELDANCQLGASFFCSRSLPECRDVNSIIPSIAYQLAQFSRPFRSALSRVLEKERNVHGRLLQIQFESLIVKPLLAVRETLPENLVVVIDALDECSNQQSTGLILDALFTKASDLPIKFFVSSRPEPEIRDQMQKQGNDQTNSRLVLHELDKGVVQADIETYLRQALAPIRLTDPQINILVQRAGILFIYAATVARFVGYDNFRRNPQGRLNTILGVSTMSGNSPYKDMDELYTVILRAAIDNQDLSNEETDDVKQVLHTVICARAPLTVEGLSGLLQMNYIARVQAALRPLWSVLHVVETSGLVTTLHASFPDYMFDSKRSKDYYCDPIHHDQTLSQLCFVCIKSVKPRLNICGLESSYILDDHIPNLNARVEKAISPELLYACRYWAGHLESDKGSPGVIEQLKDLVSMRLLLWMEVMNLKKCMYEGVGVMLQAEKWCVRQKCSEDLIQLIHDAWRFVAAYTSSPVSQSTPHIYVSMLPFWPESSPLGKKYMDRMGLPAVPQGPAISRRRLELLAKWPVDGGISGFAWSPDSARLAVVAGGKILLLDGLTSRVVVGPLKLESDFLSIGYSHDGTRIVSGSKDGAIHVWDAESGRKIVGPLQGHEKEVMSVAFSPDSTRFVSGSKDGAIRMWEVQSGNTVLGPLTGHSDTVNSVAFSPDGTRIVSGGSQKSTRPQGRFRSSRRPTSSIHIWDVPTGQIVLGPLKGHTSPVTSITFSPDGTRVASGSDDTTIRVWDIQSGQTVLGPLRGHTDHVTSVGFSPDGTHIVSGSRDKTIRVWEIQSGETVLGLLKGHASYVTSVSFSPDGTRIFSGSDDKTIHVWDIHSKQTTLDPLEGHTGGVYSVGFSPDGTRIVSGSEDRTIQVWDIQIGRMVLGPLQGHSEGVRSVGFSPDGSRIVSGSHDKAVRVWDVRTGQIVLGPLEGHTSRIESVSISPDGTRIVSASHDYTLRVWDVQSGQLVLGPLKGHTGWVNSAVFSVDGTRIVSGGGGYPFSVEDHVVIVWDVQTGQIMLGPLQGHTHAIRSVELSPDGSRVVSGSHDSTIRVWNIQSGEMILGPLKGHTGPVRSVGFSPDGTRIVSGSEDMTIRVWDIQTGQIILGPLTGHNGSVNSVGFSPDGTRIVSGSDDHTIRVWDVRGNQTASQMQLLDSAPTPVHWEIDSNGWVTDNQSRLLVWVPPDLRDALRGPREILRIFSEGYVYLNFDDVRIGESWAECYQPV